MDQKKYNTETEAQICARAWKKTGKPAFIIYCPREAMPYYVEDREPVVRSMLGEVLVKIKW